MVLVYGRLPNEKISQKEILEGFSRETQVGFLCLIILLGIPLTLNRDSNYLIQWLRMVCIGMKILLCIPIDQASLGQVHVTPNDNFQCLDKMWNYCAIEESDRYFQTSSCTIMIQTSP